MANVLSEEEVKNLMKLNKTAIKYLGLDMADVMLAEDLNGITRESKEQPASFHKRRREVITKIVKHLEEEWQKREDKLINIAKIYNFKKPKEEDINKVKEREIAELINGKYPIIMYINQVFNMIMNAEKELALLSILPAPASK